MTRTKYDQPVMSAFLSEDDIVELFANNEEFAMLWLRLMITGSQGINMPVYQRRKVTNALRRHITMLSTMLAGTEMLLDLVEDPQ